MDFFQRIHGELYCETVPLRTIAEQVGTPCYVYSYATLKRHFQIIDRAFSTVPHLICYSVKANSNGAVLTALAKLGSGADIVSGGELNRALRAGISPSKIVFSGVGKSAGELREALDRNVLMFNVESEAELFSLERIAAEMRRKAPIALRINPDVDAQSHPYISTGLRQSKFGIPLHEAVPLYRYAAQSAHLDIVGIDCHIGSQLQSLAPLKDAIRQLVSLVQSLGREQITFRYMDVGGGLGVPYQHESLPSPEDYAKTIIDEVRSACSIVPTLICEPGRLIMGNAGILLTKVLLHKKNNDKQFVIVDAAMNDLLRPALYRSIHRIQPVIETSSTERHTVDIVGPICETGDFLGHAVEVPPVSTDDLLAVMTAGAYGFSMSSNYNSRPRAAEVMVNGSEFSIIRRRETLEELVAQEQVPDWLTGS